MSDITRGATDVLKEFVSKFVTSIYFIISILGWMYFIIKAVEDNHKFEIMESWVYLFFILSLVVITSICIKRRSFDISGFVRTLFFTNIVMMFVLGILFCIVYFENHGNITQRVCLYLGIIGPVLIKAVSYGSREQNSN